ncbi:hypothetical protein AC578_3274 [Pseudocercospora eumusae]|uniref:Velvet domain-containing protein n=1 Tax=Pseudocercospora eumusae TaxID=321146 RepID=A0A139HCI6_9PEZI|nr:hypothetical protein AC578_3274 [Pseudocercospora eumusae]
MMAREQISMVVRQQPQRAQVVQENNPKNRKPIDPPPIIELKYNDRDDPANAQWLVSPRTFMMVTLINVKETDEFNPGKYLIGQTVSSLHRLKDINNKDGGFFVFGDISARKLGHYKLRFSLFDTNKESEQVVFLGSIDSDAFAVLPQRDFGSMSESTHLTRTFSDQGVKLRVRKDNRAISGIGQKRSYQPSPPENNSPGLQTGGLYGGAVQDYGSVQSPAMKRHRSSSEYDNSAAYAGMVSEAPMPYSNNSISSASRYEPRLSTGNYTSPMSMLGRSQTMGVQTPGQYPNLYQSSPPGVSAQQQPYSTFAEPQPTLPSLGSASTVPRYQTQYPYHAGTQYGAYSSGDQGYADPYGSAGSHMSSMALGSNADSAYGFPQPVNTYPEQSEAQRSYAYPGT